MTALPLPAGNTAPGAHPTPLTLWRLDRLAEARAILADFTHHRDSLNLLACKVVYCLSPDQSERAEVRDLLYVLKGLIP